MASSYQGNLATEPVRIYLMPHRPKHPAAYIPLADRYPGLRPLPDSGTPGPSLTYAAFLLLEPDAVPVVPARAPSITEASAIRFQGAAGGVS
jgi:hypothetical protein